jgi:hypothetical protein
VSCRFRAAFFGVVLVIAASSLYGQDVGVKQLEEYVLKNYTNSDSLILDGQEVGTVLRSERNNYTIELGKGVSFIAIIRETDESSFFIYDLDKDGVLERLIIVNGRVSEKQKAEIRSTGIKGVISDDIVDNALEQIENGRTPYNTRRIYSIDENGMEYVNLGKFIHERLTIGISDLKEKLNILYKDKVEKASEVFGLL